MSIGFIGCGNMAGAILSGLLNSKTVKENEINVFDIYSPTVSKLKSQYKINACVNESDVVSKSDIVILAVKPNVLLSVLEKISKAVKERNPLLISIAAGKTTD